MESLKSSFAQESVNVLLIGNNPIEMGRILDNLNEIPSLKIIPEIAFDLSSILERLLHFHPDFILIDDNLGREKLIETIHRLSVNRKTKEVPITILKNSNYEETVASSSVLDYLLKHNLSASLLYNTLKNSLKFRKTQLYLYQTYKKRRRNFLRSEKP